MLLSEFFSLEFHKTLFLLNALTEVLYTLVYGFLIVLHTDFRVLQLGDLHGKD